MKNLNDFISEKINVSTILGGGDAKWLATDSKEWKDPETGGTWKRTDQFLDSNNNTVLDKGEKILASETYTPPA